MITSPSPQWKLELLSHSDDVTTVIGMLMGKSLIMGDVVGLEGELGTGKSVLVRGMARGRGYSGVVISPTFTIIRTYPQIQLCHVDAFRLEDGGQLIDAGIEEYLDGDWICVVEWADHVREALPAGSLILRFDFGREDTMRIITVEGPGRWARIFEHINKELNGDVLQFHR